MVVGRCTRPAHSLIARNIGIAPRSNLVVWRLCDLDERWRTRAEGSGQAHVAAPHDAAWR